MTSRRTFVKQLGTAGVAASVPLSGAAAPPRGDVQLPRETAVRPLTGVWQFRLDPDDTGIDEHWYTPEAGAGEWKAVEVPHTWQVDEETTEYHGVAWYRRAFTIPASWAGQWTRFEFEAVYHSADVWLNGQHLGEHRRKGYTAFTLDASSALRPGEENVLAVRVDNAFSDEMLPRAKSYDWAEDGGITRPVNLLVTPQTFVEHVAVDAVPDLGRHTADLSVTGTVRNTTDTASEVHLGYRVLDEASGQTVLEQEGEAFTLAAGATEEVALPQGALDDPTLWHFDNPHLYRLVLEVQQNGQPTHRYDTTFGVRSITVKEGALHLNGERVWLMGVERMAGSNPEYGMAEPQDWIEHDHDDLKVLNCNLTRTHWPQDKRVLDYCDRHGILIQTEVPAWGPDTFGDMEGEASEVILQNGLEQLREMIHRDRNHPCIYSWGVANEVNGKHPPAYKFVQRLYEEAKRIDPHRLCTYASNSLQEDPEEDRAAAAVDFIMWNEYYESWYGGTPEDADANLDLIHQAFPEKPIVISEYGYCECTPDRLRGDAGRIEILREHTDVYRKHDFVAGAIYFSYNDYRTHVGDKGTGALQQRVHGVVDLYGERKPSFEALRRESSPVERVSLGRAEDGTLTATVVARKTLPMHPLYGFTLRWVAYGFGDLPMERHEVPIPDLAPGEEAQIALAFAEPSARRARIDILRPNGFSVLTEWTP